MAAKGSRRREEPDAGARCEGRAGRIPPNMRKLPQNRAFGLTPGNLRTFGEGRGWLGLRKPGYGLVTAWLRPAETRLRP